ncbi:hypothetical protein [Lachnobacterium bovis]|uniref:hypothetical protein n=1 Tax=Lachnobacterium bovis TaxID=140626 RepID=UPI0004914A05|nr:hypothetical protein [Lachnobacterium bovis]
MSNLGPWVAEKCIKKGFKEGLKEGFYEALFERISSGELEKNDAYTIANISKEDFDKLYNDWLNSEEKWSRKPQYDDNNIDYNLAFGIDDDMVARWKQECLDEFIAERNLNKGIGIGREEGIDIGVNKTLFMLVDEKTYTLEQAYQKTSLSPEEFNKAYAEWLENNKQS